MKELCLIRTSDKQTDCKRCAIRGRTTSNLVSISSNQYCPFLLKLNSGLRKWGKEGANKIEGGCETGSCFIILDVSEKCQSQIHRTFAASTLTLNDKYFCTDSSRQLIYPLQANTHPMLSVFLKYLQSLK